MLQVNIQEIPPAVEVVFGPIPTDIREIQITLTGVALVFSFILVGLEGARRKGVGSVGPNRIALAGEIPMLVHG